MHSAVTTTLMSAQKACHIRDEAYIKGLYKSMHFLPSVDSTPLFLIYFSDGLERRATPLSGVEIYAPGVRSQRVRVRDVLGNVLSDFVYKKYVLSSLK